MNDLDPLVAVTPAHGTPTVEVPAVENSCTTLFVESSKYRLLFASMAMP